MRAGRPHISRLARAAYAQTCLLRTSGNFCLHRLDSTHCAPAIWGAEQELPPFVWRVSVFMSPARFVCDDADLAERAIVEAGISDKITIRRGDAARLADIF